MTLYYEDDLVRLYHGDAADMAAALEPGSVQTIVTSPPYFGLRDYGVDEQLGAETTVQEYVDRLVGVFRACRDALADDGTLWVNLGDSYSSPVKGSGGTGKSTLGAASGGNGISAEGIARSQRRQQTETRKLDLDVPAKNLLGVPWRVAFALQADGWILRSDIIWAKPNPMPESVTDRPTKAHEYLFLFAKSPRYYYDADAVREQYSNGDGWIGRASESFKPNADRGDGGRPPTTGNPDGRNKRTIWEVATVPFPGSHFAVYPPELIRPCILAGSRPGDVVLDPFSGSGTTGMVATQEGRRYVGFDVNRDYLALSLRMRFAQPVLNFGGVA